MSQRAATRRNVGKYKYTMIYYIFIQHCATVRGAAAAPPSASSAELLLLEGFLRRFLTDTTVSSSSELLLLEGCLLRFLTDTTASESSESSDYPPIYSVKRSSNNKGTVFQTTELESRPFRPTKVHNLL